MRKLIGYSAVLAFALVFAGCSTLANQPPLIANAHPAWAANPATCAELGTVISLLGFIPGAGTATSAIAGAVVGNAFCSAEAKLVAGPPAVVTTTTTATTSTAKSGS